MKARLTALLVTGSICISFAEPGQPYTLPGREKGIAEIIKADMAHYPELYKGETFKRYQSRFKAANNIGRKKYNLADQLQFPPTAVTRQLKKEAAGSSGKPAKIDCDARFVRFREGSRFFSDAEKYLFDIPERFGGDRLMLRKKYAHDPVDFEVTRAGTVTLVTDSQGAKYFEAQGWEKVDKFVIARQDRSLSIELLILTKDLGVGHYSIPDRGQFETRLLVK